MPPKKKARSASSSTTASPPSRPPFEDKDGEDEEEEDAAAASQDDAEENDTEVQEEEAEGDAAAADDDDGTKQPARKKATKKKKVKESVIDHTYRDYSQVEAPLDDDDDDDETGGGTTTKGKSELSSRGFQSFPSKLHAILSNPNYQHIIRWMVSERGYHHFGYFRVVPVLLLLSYLTPANINIVLFSLFLRQFSPMGGVGLSS